MRAVRNLSCALSLFCFAGILAAQVNYTYQFYPTSGPAFGVASGDFSRHGLPDLAVGSARTAGAFVDVFKNTGQGKFGSFAEYPLDFTPGQIIAADINGDGFLDLVVAFAPGSNAGVNFLDTLLNNGDGTFRTGPRIPLRMPQAGALAAGDLNSDGKVDLVVDEINTTTNSSQFEVLLGTGTGTFTTSQVLAMAHISSMPVIADFNGDGKLDIANNENGTPNNALVWWGNGNGTFSTPTKFAIPSGSSGDITSADFNNDGLPDLAFQAPHSCGSPPCGYNTVYVYKNNGNKTFTRVSSFNIGPTAGGNLYTADLNGDGFQDIINDNQQERAGGVDYALGNGNGTFGTQGSFQAADAPFDLVTRDFNLDSRRDIAISGQVGGGIAVGLATSGVINCAPPGSATLAAKICTPGNNSSVTSPVTVRASGNSPAGVKRLEIWVDGVKKYQRLYDQVAKSFALAAGAHRITVVAVDQYVGIAKNTATINVH